MLLYHTYEISTLTTEKGLKRQEKWGTLHDVVIYLDAEAN